MKNCFIKLSVYLLGCSLLLCGCHRDVSLKAAPKQSIVLDESLLPIYSPEALQPSVADVRLVIDQKGHPNLRLKGFMLLKPAASFRLEIDGAIGSGTALACDGQIMTMINSYEQSYLAISGQNISRSGLVAVPLGCDDLVAILHGQLPEAARESKLSLARGFDKSSPKLANISFKYKKLYWNVFLQPSGDSPYLIKKIELRDNRRDDPLAIIEITDFLNSMFGPRPGKVILSVPEKVSTTIKFDDYEDSEPSPELFILNKPRGYK